MTTSCSLKLAQRTNYIHNYKLTIIKTLREKTANYLGEKNQDRLRILQRIFNARKLLGLHL